MDDKDILEAFKKLFPESSTGPMSVRSPINYNLFGFIEGVRWAQSRNPEKVCEWEAGDTENGLAFITQCCHWFKHKYNFCPDCGGQIIYIEGPKIIDNKELNQAKLFKHASKILQKKLMK
jgi:hypothetical protein